MACCPLNPEELEVTLCISLMKSIYFLVAFLNITNVCIFSYAIPLSGDMKNLYKFNHTKNVWIYMAELTILLINIFHV